MTAHRTTDTYDPHRIERTWQERWAADRLYETDIAQLAAPEKFYNLVEFPYPSAEGLHVGHAYTYSGADTYGRYLRMRGRKVFQPIGFDAFGIHTENYALRVGEHPLTLTARTIATYRRQLSALGAAWDWSRELVTSEPGYYRWTQWLFLQLHRAGLTDRRQAPVVWCPSCKTVLANEQLEGERCERCGTRVEERSMLQWFLRITRYADALLAGLDDLDWPEAAKRVQREWIGRSEGAEIEFAVSGHPDLRLRAFTTRPDTLFGVTFLVVPPDHPTLVSLLSEAERAEVGRMLRVSQRSMATEPKRGRSTGASAVHPVTGHPIPVYLAEYVVAGYGSGAVMGVPAHDARDLAFARAHGLPMTTVVQPPPGSSADPDAAWTGEGTLVASGSFSGMPSDAAREAIVDWLEDHELGRRAISYRLRDWLISRQRYWGPPIPIVHCERCGTVPVPEKELPVLLPEVADFRPTGSEASPLASVPSFVETSCPACAGPARRETDVSDAFFDSSWYFVRYPSTDVADAPWDEERTRRILPVDTYAGGPEHVMRHHLYARFVTRALHDLGLLPFAEPFPRLRLHGMLTKDGAKMSKSRGNVVNPDEYIAAHGADVTRMYLLFIGPFEAGGDFSDAGIAGIERFLQRVWRLATGEHRPGPGGAGMDRLDRAVVGVGEHLERMEFNTGISTLMELVRWIRSREQSFSTDEWARVRSTLIRLLAPFAPHLAEELWARIGEPYSVHRAPWPGATTDASSDTEITMVVQVDGRLRARLHVRRGISRKSVLELALADPNVVRHLDGKRPEEVVFVPDRLINLVRAASGQRNVPKKPPPDP